jgi:hypothetical protein
MLNFQSPNDSYQVGGSLPFNAPTYVYRQADESLFKGLLRGEFFMCLTPDKWENQAYE